MSEIRTATDEDGNNVTYRIDSRAKGFAQLRSKIKESGYKNFLSIGREILIAIKTRSDVELLSTIARSNPLLYELELTVPLNLRDGKVSSYSKKLLGLPSDSREMPVGTKLSTCLLCLEFLAGKPPKQVHTDSLDDVLANAGLEAEHRSTLQELLKTGGTERLGSDTQLTVDLDQMVMWGKNHRLGLPIHVDLAKHSKNTISSQPKSIPLLSSANLKRVNIDFESAKREALHKFFDQVNVGVPNAYLQLKNLRTPSATDGFAKYCLGSVCNGDVLIVPVFGRSGSKIVLQSLQYIQADGKKTFQSGCTVKGGFFPFFSEEHKHMINSKQSDRPAKYILCEGVADALTIYLALNKSVTVCCGFSANFLQAAAYTINKVFMPDARPIVFADSDKNQLGKKCAESVVKKFGGEVILPPNGYGDFNDAYKSSAYQLTEYVNKAIYHETAAN